MTLWCNLLLTLLCSGALCHGRLVHSGQTEDDIIALLNRSEDIDWESVSQSENDFLDTHPGSSNGGDIDWESVSQSENNFLDTHPGSSNGGDIDWQSVSQSENNFLDAHPGSYNGGDIDWESVSQSESNFLDAYPGSSNGDVIGWESVSPLRVSRSAHDINWENDNQSGDAVLSPRRVSRSAEEVDWNGVIDNLIQDFIKRTSNEVSLPDLDKTYSVPVLKHFLPKSFSLTLRGSHGFLKSVHSLHRLGDVSVSSDEPRKITALFKFGSMRLRYEDFHVTVVKVGPHGRLDASVPDNSVRLRLRLHREQDQCRLVYEDVSMVHVANVDLKLTGLGPLNKIYSKVATKIVKLLRDCVSNALERLFAARLRDLFDNQTLSCA